VPDAAATKTSSTDEVTGEVTEAKPADSQPAELEVEVSACDDPVKTEDQAAKVE